MNDDQKNFRDADGPSDEEGQDARSSVSQQAGNGGSFASLVAEMKGNASSDDPAERVAAEIEEVHQPDDALPPVSLSEVPQSIQDACERAGWRSLMPVQAHSFPYLLSRRDLMVQSRTGSGKTGTYLLPALEQVDPDNPVVQMLILVPTRELAVQVEHEAKTLFADTGLRAAAVYGGVGFGRQLQALEQGAQVVVGTPGRVLDHLLRRTMTLDALRVLIFDEADRMLSIGFYPDMKEIGRYVPRRRSTFLLSATYPPNVIKLAGEFMKEPAMLSLSHKQVHVAEISHVYYDAKPMEKDRVLVRVLEMENPDSAIIFCNTKANVHYVTAVLKGFGYNADELSADLSQSKREAVLKRLREGRVRFLVATDVAARGIDIPALSHVVLYEPPEDRESYIHRAGRTGRAGASGEVISLVDIMQKMELERIANHYKIPLEHRETPSDEDVAQVAGARITALLEAKLRTSTTLQKERMKRFIPLLREMQEDDEQLLVVAQLLDELYQENLHAAPPAPAGGPASGEKKVDGQSGRRDGGQNQRSGRSGHSPRRSGHKGRQDNRGSRGRDADRTSRSGGSGEKRSMPRGEKEAGERKNRQDRSGKNDGRRSSAPRRSHKKPSGDTGSSGNRE